MVRFGPTSVELCAGGGGQAVGLEMAGFEHAGLFENDRPACNTLRQNRPHWAVHEHDLFAPFDFSGLKGVDLVAGGLPCPPFSIAGKQLGEKDERNLFTRGVEIVDQIRPRAVMFENVRGMMGASFAEYRMRITNWLERMDYVVDWKLLQASDYGVSQLRPRVVMVALQSDCADGFKWPDIAPPPKTVGDLLFDQMAANGWQHAKAWRLGANKIAPTIVGGSKKHGGPDLGPTRARAAWKALGVNGGSIAEQAPEPDFEGLPRLTVPMVARIQGFPDDWQFWGAKTASYRQVGNAFPPPVAQSVAECIHTAIGAKTSVLVAAE